VKFTGLFYLTFRVPSMIQIPASAKIFPYW